MPDEKIIKVLALNCWGLPWSSDLKIRMPEIGKSIAEKGYDIVMLTEAWREGDRKILQGLCSESNPYSFYYEIGFIGSGVFILSKYPILDTNIVTFPNIGKLYHTGGDWFGSKSVAYAKIDYPGHIVKVFATHTQAAYANTPNDEIRGLQMYYLGRIVNQMSTPDDIVIMGGDLNSESHEPGIRFLTEHCRLHDCFVDVFGQKADEHHTCNGVQNSYSSPDFAPCRIDYIYRNENLRTEDCGVVFKKMPSSKKDFSDHYGVEATFALTGKGAEEVSSTCAKSASKEADSAAELKAQFITGISKSAFPLSTFSLLIAPIILIFCSLYFSVLSNYSWVVALCCTIGGLYISAVVFMLLIVLVVQRDQKRIFQNFTNEITLLYQV